VKLRSRGTAILILASLLTIALLTGVAAFLTNRQLADAKDENFRLMREVLSSVQKSTEDRAISRAEIIASMSSVRTAFIARDRERLLAECAQMFKIQDEKYGVSNGQFHLPPGVSFLRLHKPTVFGDDQTSYRPMLTEANAKHVPLRGIAISRSGPSVAGVVPIADDSGKHVGSFEIGLEFAPMLDKIKQAYNIEASVFIEEKILREIATDLGGDVMTPKNRVGRYMRYYATHPDLAAALVTAKEIDVKQPTQFDRAHQGTRWAIQLIPLHTYDGRQVGVYALALNESGEKTAAGRARVWQLLAALFGSVFLSGAVLVIVRGLLLAPVQSLGERMGLLVAGDASHPADELDTYVEEVQPIAESYERLRSEETKKT